MIRFAFFPVLRFAFFAALALVSLSRGVCAGQTSMKGVAIPQTLEKMRGLMGGEYAYLEQDGLLVVSDLDKKTLYQLVSRDFLIYMHVLKRDFFTSPLQDAGKSAQAILTVFLFNNRESYVKGLRKIGFDIAEGDEKNAGAVRNGMYYWGRERNFILINYSEDYERGLSIYAHEATHALMRKEFPRAPSWISEGMATMVENSRIINSHLRYENRNGSSGRLRKAIKAGKMPSVPALLKLTGEDFGRRKNSMPFYDAGEQFCRFLHTRNQLLPIYSDLRDNARGRETDAEIISRVTGLALGNLEKAWHDWLLRQE